MVCLQRAEYVVLEKSCEFVGCVCCLHQSAYVPTLARQLGVALVGAMVWKQTQKIRWANGFSKWFDWLLVTKMMLDEKAMAISRQGHLSTHHCFVALAVKTVMEADDSLAALAVPVVYLWAAPNDSKLVYFGQSARGFLVRIKEELEHSIKHKLGVKCSVEKAKGRCDEMLAQKTADYGVHKMHVVPCLFCM